MPTLADVFGTDVERELRRTSAQIGRARAELAVVDDQLASLTADADDARLRSLVSETPLAEVEAATAGRHAGAMRRRRDELVADIDRLLARQDGLLDRLGSSR